MRGECGIGRTTFLAEAALAATGAGFRTARARCHPQGHQEQFSAVRQLLEDLGSLPQTATGFARRVTAAQLERPVLLLVDDLHWCDTWSLQALSHLRHRLAGLRVVLLASIRGDLPASHPEPCRDLVTELRQLQLRGLDRNEAEQLVREILPGDPDPGFVTECLRRTGGNPRLLEALLTELAEHEVAPDRGGAGLLPRYAPQSVAQHVQAMAGGPGSAAWQLAGALAVLGGQASPAWTAQVAGLAPERAVEAADLLFRAELLAPGGTLTFRHPVLGDAVARHQPVGSAARLHDRAAALARDAAAGTGLGRSAGVTIPLARPGARGVTGRLGSPDTPTVPVPVPALPDPSDSSGLSGQGVVPPVVVPLIVDRRRSAPPLLELRCLGGFRMLIAGAPVDCAGARPKTRRLLRLLAMNGGRPVHREVLLEAFWPDLPRVTGIRNLQVTVSRLRELLGAGLLCRTGDAYGLALGAQQEDQVVSDVREFERAADAARPLDRTRDAAVALTALRTARTWYVGDLLPEEGPAEWVVQERERLRARAAEVGAWLADAELAAGRTGAAVEAAEYSLRLEPFHDGAWRALIGAYHRAGDLASSERVSRQYDSLLASLD